MTTDPLAPLLALADIADAVEQARTRFDSAQGHRALRRHGGQVAAEVSLRSAVASAALEGRSHEREAVRAGTVTEPVLQGALRVAGALPGLSDHWSRAPRQALAKLHVLAGRDVVDAAELGRPVDDPVVAARLDALVGLITGGTKVPPLVLAAVVHGELLNLRPFAGPSGVVARGAARLVLLSSGFDPRGLLAIDVGHHEREPEYVGAAGAFATGTPDGLRSWLRHYMSAVEVGADQLTEIGAEVLAAG
ncbi:oxidoreductase [Micromonospora zingiberis]|uniref:Oxidoreductase n=1 Tax=Micromonospora zingiberis TaxID=2053011 RepID=A0A4R0GCG9_9ACTN|nr:oxidoreductase [Micromonospora zingiberis]TCB92791.1 oxidoreductase [Micromonospora zingiberis]